MKTLAAILGIVLVLVIIGVIVRVADHALTLTLHNVSRLIGVNIGVVFVALGGLAFLIPVGIELFYKIQGKGAKCSENLCAKFMIAGFILIFVVSPVLYFTAK